MIKLSATERRRISVFLTCLFIAVLAWLVVAFSSTYSYTTKKVVRYINVPLKRSFHSLQSDTIEAVVKGTGWQMMFARMKDNSRPVRVDLRALETRPYVTLSTQLQRINNEMPKDNPIVAFNPDTLYFDFSNRSIKRIPVKLMSGIGYQKQYGQSDNAVIEPSYVTISGPSAEIDATNNWPTDSLKIKNVNENIVTNLSLKSPKAANIAVYPKTVKITIPVNEFTEKTLNVPVRIINNANFYNIKLVPQRIAITFTTSLDKYADIDADMFEAQVDMEYWQKYGYTKLPVKIIRVPEFCKVVRIEPRNIDFIVKR